MSACPPEGKNGKPGPPMPFYADMGKQARGIFSRGYNMGGISLVFRSQAPASGLVFGSSVTHNLLDGKISGGSDLKFTYPYQKLVYVQKWNSNNEVIADLSGSDVLTKGLGFGVTTQFAPSTGEYNLASKFNFANENAAASIETDVFKAKTLSGGVAVGANGFSVGTGLIYGMEKRKFEKLQFGAAYDTPTTSVFATLWPSREIIGGVYHRVSNCVEMGVALKQDISSDDDRNKQKNEPLQVAIGGRIALDQNATVGAKLEMNTAKLCTFYEQKIGNVFLNFSSAVDMNKLDSGAHKIGLGITLET